MVKSEICTGYYRTRIIMNHPDRATHKFYTPKPTTNDLKGEFRAVAFDESGTIVANASVRTASAP